MGIVFAFFDFVRTNKAAQIALTAGIIVLVWLGNNAHQRARGRRQFKAAAEIKEMKVITKIERVSNDAIQNAEEARANAPVYSSSDSVPDSVASHIFKD